MELAFKLVRDVVICVGDLIIMDAEVFECSQAGGGQAGTIEDIIHISC